MISTLGKKQVTIQAIKNQHEKRSKQLQKECGEQIQNHNNGHSVEKASLLKEVQRLEKLRTDSSMRLNIKYNKLTEKNQMISREYEALVNTGNTELINEMELERTSIIHECDVRIMKLRREFENEKRRTIDENAQSSSNKRNKETYEESIHSMEIKQRETLVEEEEIP